MIIIKKNLFFLVIVLFLISACQNETSSVSSLFEINYSEEIEERLNSEYALELLNRDENTAYIAFKSSGDVTSTLEQDKETLIIHFDVENSENDTLQQRVYELTTDPEIEAIEVFIDGEMTPFDNVTSIGNK